MPTEPQQTDIVAEAREFIAIVGNCGLYPDKAQRLLRQLADEVERLRKAESALENIYKCDGCELCENH